MICNDYSESAFASGRRICEVVHNQSELSVQTDFRYDASMNEDEPWFISYGDEENWEPLSEEDYDQRMSNYGDPIHIDFTPFSSLK